MVAVVAALAVGGCGADGTAERDTRARFVAAADAVCVRTAAAVAPVTRRTEAARRGGDRERELVEVGRLTRQSAALQRRGLDGLDALQPPAGDGDAVKAWIAGLRRRAAALDGLGDAYAGGSQALIAGRAELAEVLREDAARFAQRYGLRACVAFP